MAVPLSVFKKVTTAKASERNAGEWHWMHLGILECEWCRLGYIVKTALSCPMPVPLRFWHVLAMWQAPTKRSGTIHGWQREIPVIELLTAHLLLTWLSKRELFGSNKCMLQLCKSSNKCSPYRTSVQYLDTSAKQAAVCFLTGMLHCFIAVIQMRKSECTPCCMQSGHLLPVLRNSHCGVYKGTHEFLYSVETFYPCCFLRISFWANLLRVLVHPTARPSLTGNLIMDLARLFGCRYFWRFEELDNQSWMNSSATTLKVQIHLSKL